MNATVYLKHEISAAHWLEGYDGPCVNLHGHTFLIEVWCKGPIQDDGMVIDFKQIKDILNEYDHRTLNFVMDVQPTAENFAVLLLSKIPFAIKVRVWESGKAYAEVNLGDL